MTGIKIYVNISEEDESRAISPNNFVEIDTDLDRLILSTETLAVRDNVAEPSEHDLAEASLLIKPAEEVVVPACFIVDRSNNNHELQKIFNFNKNKRYTFCVEFDDLTLDEPELQIWDNIYHNSTKLHCLGNGSVEESWIYAVLTTDDLPGDSWVGTKVAGLNSLLLNNGGGALINSKTIYFNLRCTIPENYPFSDMEEMKLMIRFKTN